MSGFGSRLDAGIEQMREYYPEFSLRVLPTETRRVAVWKGTVKPVQTGEGLADLLDDIHQGRPVAVAAGGEVRHLDPCLAGHRRH